MSSVILRLDSPKSAPSRRRPGSISRSLLRRQVGIKINPVPIICLDQIDLPVSPPLLDLLFATQRRFVVVVNLKPNQPIYSVFRREPGTNLFLCSHTRRDKLAVNPMYSVPYGLLASRYTKNIAPPAKWVPAYAGMVMNLI